MIGVVHVISGLDTGGAEMMLYKLLSRADRARFSPAVVSLTRDGAVGDKIRALGIPVHALGMTRGVPNPVGVLRLAALLRRLRPGLVQTWMYHADVVGGLAAKFAGGMPVVWGIRQSNLDRPGTRRGTILTARGAARLSRRLPAAIVCGSEAARRTHEALGYAREKMVVIPNGFDLDAFAPSARVRTEVREELGLGEDVPLIGLAARFDPQKDHRNFVRAAGLLHERLPQAHFVLCGEGVSWQNNQLIHWIEEAGVRGNCHLLGRRADMERINAALDIAASSSWGEGFPNVVGEAMACGVPCVVTDVGDSAQIVADTGRVVPPRDPGALAGAWGELLALPAEARRALGLAARRRIEQHYSLGAVVTQYEDLYDRVLGAQCAE